MEKDGVSFFILRKYLRITYAYVTFVMEVFVETFKSLVVIWWNSGEGGFRGYLVPAFEQ